MLFADVLGVLVAVPRQSQKRGRAAEVRGKKKEGKNAGVDDRAAKDLAEASNPASREREVYDRLLKKSKLYDKLSTWQVVLCFPFPLLLSCARMERRCVRVSVCDSSEDRWRAGGRR